MDRLASAFAIAAFDTFSGQTTDRQAVIDSYADQDVCVSAQSIRTAMRLGREYATKCKRERMTRYEFEQKIANEPELVFSLYREDKDKRHAKRNQSALIRKAS